MHRYQCRLCGKHFSSRTGQAAYGQHRPDLNDTIFQLYASGMTQRRMAILLKTTRKTIARKILFIATLARQAHREARSLGTKKVSSVQFDEMETFEHTKLKPVTVALAVRSEDGEILATEVAPLAYKGPLAAVAFKKYGPREDESPKAIASVLASLKDCRASELYLTTDCSPRYPKAISTHLSPCQHFPTQRENRERSSDRKNLNDPLFTLNYTCAKLRNDLSRLSRKTWVTTKRLWALQAHLDLYTAWNNKYVLVA